jgi:hypothetical protein
VLSHFGGASIGVAAVELSDLGKIVVDCANSVSDRGAYGKNWHPSTIGFEIFDADETFTMVISNPETSQRAVVILSKTSAGGLPDRIKMTCCVTADLSCGSSSKVLVAHSSNGGPAHNYCVEVCHPLSSVEY